MLKNWSDYKTYFVFIVANTEFELIGVDVSKCQFPVSLQNVLVVNCFLSAVIVFITNLSIFFSFRVNLSGSILIHLVSSLGLTLKHVSFLLKQSYCYNLLLLSMNDTLNSWFRSPQWRHSYSVSLYRDVIFLVGKLLENSSDPAECYMKVQVTESILE